MPQVFKIGAYPYRRGKTHKECNQGMDNKVRKLSAGK